MKPEAIPSRLSTTWKRVKVDNVIPRIMSLSFQNQDVIVLAVTLPTN
jgi:hypothetical protein